MNGNDILKALNGADERYLAEYEHFERVRSIKVSRKVKIGAAIAAAAAVAVLTVPAGAYVYELTHKDEVKLYLEGDSAEYIEQNGLAMNYVSENEHIRLTIDTLLSDGHIGMAIMTVEGLDEQGLEAVGGGGIPEIYLADVDTEEYIQWGDYRSHIVCGGSISYDTRTDTQYTFMANIRLDKIDAEKDYLLKFGMDGDDSDGCEYDEDHTIVDNLMEGVALEMNFSPNVECTELSGENGEQIWLSQIGVFSADEEFVTKNFCSSKRPALIKNGGVLRKADLVDSYIIELRQPGIEPVYCGWFDKIIDVDKYAGVEVNGSQYLKNE